MKHQVGIACLVALVLGGLQCVVVSAKIPRGVSPPTAEAVNSALKDQRVEASAPTPPDRLFVAGMGVGIPNLVTAEVAVQVLRHWQVGVGYGLIPGAENIIPAIPLPTQRIILLDTFTYLVEGVARTNLEIFQPFIRYFPTRRTTYLQLTANLLRTYHRVTSGLVNEDTQTAVPGASIQADVTFTHVLPTVSLGHFFWNSFMYLNVSLGATFLFSSTSTLALSTEFPGPLGDAFSNAPQIQQLESNINRELGRMVEQARSELALIPSLAVTVGVMF